MTRSWHIALLVGVLALVSVGFACLPRDGAAPDVSMAQSQGTTLVFTSTSAAATGLPSVTVQVSTSVAAKTASATAGRTATPLAPATDTPTVNPEPTATHRPKTTPTPTATHHPRVSPTATATHRPKVSPTPTAGLVAGKPTSATSPISPTVAISATSAITTTASAEIAAGVSTITETNHVTATAALTATESLTSAVETPTVIPLPTPDGVSRWADVPILMYHYISVPPPGADIYRQDLSVTPAAFEEQLAWLRSQGYESISLEQLVDFMAQGQPIPEKSVILTFDDGYRDAYTNAFPLLKQYGFTATFFLVTKPIDEANVDYLTWEMVQEMHTAGMSMQDHSYSHADLSAKPVDYLVYEIVGAKEAIEARTGETVRFFCYPSGSYDRNTIAVLRSAGFWAATTTKQGTIHTSDDLFELTRIRMRGGQSIGNFEELVTAEW